MQLPSRTGRPDYHRATAGSEADIQPETDHSGPYLRPGRSRRGGGVVDALARASKPVAEEGVQPTGLIVLLIRPDGSRRRMLDIRRTGNVHATARQVGAAPRGGGSGWSGSGPGRP
ncbi:hypothetical protein GCM10009665_70110 [Kitasatospora nipponensis]|uniref:Uncharacterized protein n=1 Tax=Kitasatospora nipponensis TaxID=258049 RepID=A0ABN1X116_9ACTN